MRASVGGGGASRDSFCRAGFRRPVNRALDSFTCVPSAVWRLKPQQRNSDQHHPSESLPGPAMVERYPDIPRTSWNQFQSALRQHAATRGQTAVQPFTGLRRVSFTSINVPCAIWVEKRKENRPRINTDSHGSSKTRIEQLPNADNLSLDLRITGRVKGFWGARKLCG